ncbi:alpha/beta hydrolase [Streptomyces hydrogenans]|uniref:alpha/beta hydrolase n=1 Tax=Streptomyces hydrogenans TaxID=1873719 RepID=UPI003802CAFF
MNEAKPPYWEQLDPDARSVARFLAETLKKPVRELGAEVARQVFATPRPEQPLTPLDRVECLTLATRSGELRARLYHPDGPPAAGPRPVLVYLHGGGFVLGTLDGVDEVCRAIAARSGWAVFSLEYRLAPENPYPAALDDCFDAFFWLRRAASVLGIDPEAIAVGGDSAGGNLAAALCLKLRDLGLAQPVSQVLVYPAVDGAFAAPSWTDFAEAPLLTSADARWFWDQYIGSDRGEAVDQYAAPMRAESLRNLPPALVLTAEVDPLRDDAEAYAERLRRDGVEVASVRCAGVFHGFFTEVGVFAKTDEAISRVALHLRGLAEAGPGS